MIGLVAPPSRRVTASATWMGGGTGMLSCRCSSDGLEGRNNPCRLSGLRFRWFERGHRHRTSSRSTIGAGMIDTSPAPQPP